MKGKVNGKGRKDNQGEEGYREKTNKISPRARFFSQLIIDSVVYSFG